jgi:hypothetical protein
MIFDTNQISNISIPATSNANLDSKEEKRMMAYEILSEDEFTTKEVSCYQPLGLVGPLTRLSQMGQQAIAISSSYQDFDTEFDCSNTISTSPLEITATYITDESSGFNENYAQQK